MRGLLLNDEVTKRIKDQVAWAERQENWYRPQKDKEPPGDNPAYVLMIEMGFRVVYTHTVIEDHHYRHLSISVEGTKYPHPIAAWTIATLFGFTGGVEEHEMTTEPGKDWLMQVRQEERCVVIAQEIPYQGEIS
jgi:hypothetical protein